MANKFFKKRRLTLIQQRLALNSIYKELNCTLNKKKNQLDCFGIIKPTPFSKEYKVAIYYKFGKSPQVWISGDELEKLDAKDFPHRFDIDVKNKKVRICLYRYSEFNENRLLADTIIPWVVEWLYFYELWVVTGEWLGGGEHPNDGNEKRDDFLKKN